MKNIARTNYKVKIWDLYIRLNHIGMITLILLCYFSVKNGDMDTHFICGYLLMGLIITRIIWGIFGSYSARFSSFIRFPIHIFYYFRDRNHDHFESHNPAGGYMVMLLLCLISTQIITGLFATDDIFADGPLADMVSYAFSKKMTSLHYLNFDILFIAICFHVSAVLIYLLLLKQNLIVPMITGHKKHYRDVQLTKHPIFAFLILFVVYIVIFIYLIGPIIYTNF